MERRYSVEAALAAWRDAERRLARAVDGEADVLAGEVGRNRDEYQRLSAANMVEWIARLDEAEGRRANATPSTPPFHETDLNKRTTPRPVAPGLR